MLAEARHITEEVGVAPSRAALMPLLRELGHLKRITSAGRRGTIAARLFVRAWGTLLAGAPAEQVMERTVAAALAAARLGDLDFDKLCELGLSRDEALAVLQDSFDAVTDGVDQALAQQLRTALGVELADAVVPAFVQLLADQPRAGVTCPGKPRLVLQPTENHAEHCLIVAVYAGLLAPSYGADPTRVFLAGIGHHFHNAAMPDSGFTGEVLLGDRLDQVIANAKAAAMAELPGALQLLFADALAPIGDDRTPEGQAFNAADVIDRVLEIEQHITARQATMDLVLGDYALAHDGPVKRFHDATLREVGLL